MAAPMNQTLTPYGKVTEALAIGTGEFWQLVGNDVFIVYENVPYDVMANLTQSRQIDSDIALLLAAYLNRIAA